MIEIKTLKSVEEFRKTIEIQKSAWGFSDLDVENHYLMTRTQKYGGLVQGLYLDGNCIGFTFALLGKWKDDYFIYSHMTAVKKEYQGKGYGFLLKKAQRQEILRMGYDTMHWNFDPLESLNAFFNFQRLGVTSSEYERNIYGTGESGLHRGLPTDRLIATWELKSKRVRTKMKKREPIIMESVPENRIGRFHDQTAYIEIPADIRTMKKKDLKLAIAWRLKTRELFEKAFSKKWVAREMVRCQESQRIFCKLFPE
jgi:predicted GNAT superfamily acetyltransferase